MSAIDAHPPERTIIVLNKIDLPHGENVLADGRVFELRVVSVRVAHNLEGVYSKGKISYILYRRISLRFR